MKCPHCNSEWKTDEKVSSSLTSCPFCGKSLVKEEAPKKYDNSKDALAAIMKQFGPDILLGKLNAHFPDFASVLEGDKRLVYAVHELGAAKVLKSSLAAPQADKEIAVKIAIRTLTEAHISQDSAETVVSEFAAALGWQAGSSLPSNKAPKAANKKNTVQIPQNQLTSSPVADPLLKRAFMFLEDGDWESADEYCERVLDADPENAKAYAGKLCAELEIKDETELANHKSPLDNMPNYQKALRFADTKYHAELGGYNKTITERIAEEQRKIKPGSVIPFGPYNWRVLDKQGGEALIITEEVIEQRKYNNVYKDVSWETCDLRKYLNGGFLRKFTKEQQGRIVEKRIRNPGNLWYGTAGGSDTRDKVFLLSLEEADKYFGNSGDYLNKKRKNGNQIADSNGYWLSNNHDGERVAKDGNGTACWWWLRSPGDVSRDAAYVDVGGGVGVYGGRVYVNGIKVILDYGGVRPALWLNL